MIPMCPVCNAPVDVTKMYTVISFDNFDGVYCSPECYNERRKDGNWHMPVSELPSSVRVPGTTDGTECDRTKGNVDTV